jgi:site-specific DNA recombinase
MTGAQCALYARVSSESQARDNTIASQVTALRERIACGRLSTRTGSQLRG